MLFRSRNDVPVRLALLSGHTAVVGPEWRSLPAIFHAEAYRQGCQAQDSAEVQETPIEPGPDASNQKPSPDDAYRQALTTMVGRSEEGDFTAASLPNINVVSKLCGFTARKEDVLRVFRQMKEEAGAGA